MLKRVNLLEQLLSDVVGHSRSVAASGVCSTAKDKTSRHPIIRGLPAPGSHSQSAHFGLYCPHLRRTPCSFGGCFHSSLFMLPFPPLLSRNREQAPSPN